MVSFRAFLCALISTASLTAAAELNTTTADLSSTAGLSKTPKAPELKFLYTSFVNLTDPVSYGAGPKGPRAVVPIVGGNFTGPKLKGNVLNLGADWLLVDTKTGFYYPDTRYGFQTDDGAFIFVQSQGTVSPATGELHLRFIFETGAPAYYWLNNATSVGVGKQVATRPGGTTLRIDTWYF